MNETTPIGGAAAHRIPAAAGPWARPAVVAGFVLAVTAFKLAMAASTDFVRDEAYYSLWALHPLAPGYFDHPPGVAWFIAAGYALLGESETAARLLAVLSTVPICWAIWRTASIVFADRRIAALSVYFYAATPASLIGLTVITPDAPSMLFWALAIWAAAELLRSGDDRWWLAFGLFAGLGLAAKYTGLFLGAGILVWLIADRRNWRWFASAWLYAGGALALAVFAPVVAWNLGNGLSSFAFQFGRTTRGLQWFDWTQLRHFPEFLAGQAALLLPGLFAVIIAAYALFARRAAVRGDRGVSLLVWTGVPALAYFVALSLHSVVQGNWTWPLYAQWSMLGAWAAFAWQGGGRTGAALRRLTIAGHVPLGLVAVAVVFAQALWQPVRAPFNDQTLAMHGWNTVAADVERLRGRAGVDTVLVRDYGLLGYLVSYGRFGGHGYRALPLDEFHRYGFIDLPASDDALDWPLLVAVPAMIGAAPQPPPALTDRRPAPRHYARIVRPGADGSPAGAIDLYLLARPEPPLFGDG